MAKKEAAAATETSASEEQHKAPQSVAVPQDGPVAQQLDHGPEQWITSAEDRHLDEFRRLKQCQPSRDTLIVVDSKNGVFELLLSDFVVEKVVLQQWMLQEARPLLESRTRCGRVGPATVLVSELEILTAASGIDTDAAGKTLAFATARQPSWVVAGPLADRLLAFADEAAPLRVLALDGLTDPGNVGQLLRAAHHFGVAAVLFSEACLDPFHLKSIRASEGIVFRMPVFRGRLPEMIRELREERGVMTAACVVQDGAVFLDEVRSMPRRWAVVVGSECLGVADETRKACEMLLKVRMASGVDSLNVVMSGGVLIHGCIEREARADS